MPAAAGPGARAWAACASSTDLVKGGTHARSQSDDLLFVRRRAASADAPADELPPPPAEKMAASLLPPLGAESPASAPAWPTPPAADDKAPSSRLAEDDPASLERASRPNMTRDCWWECSSSSCYRPSAVRSRGKGGLRVSSDARAGDKEQPRGARRTRSGRGHGRQGQQNVDRAPVRDD
jgi:hypothetical protein